MEDEDLQACARPNLDQLAAPTGLRAPASRSPRVVRQRSSHLCFLPALLTWRNSGSSRCYCFFGALAALTDGVLPALACPLELASLLFSCCATSRSAPCLAILQLSYTDSRACTRHDEGDRICASGRPGRRGSSSSVESPSPANWHPHRFTRARSIRCESSPLLTLRRGSLRFAC